MIFNMTTNITPIVQEVNALVITDSASMTAATMLLSQVNQQLDQVKAEEEKVLKPLRDAAAAEKARWKPMKDALADAVLKIRTSMSAYQTAEVQRQKEAETKIAARVEKGTLKMETGVRKIEELEKVDKKVETAAGSVNFVTDHEVVIEDITRVPFQYLKVELKKLEAKKSLKAGIFIPGLSLKEIQVPRNLR